MPLLDVITQGEANELAAAILTQMPFVNAELTALERMPPSARDLCYGPRILQSTYGVRDDMVDLLAEAVSRIRDCPVGDGKHYFVRESDGVRVCQKCGDVR